MAEPTNPGQPSSDATERGSPVNVNTSGNVTVTRKDVATGDVKSLQEELLKELCKCIEEQTKTLGGVINDTKKEISNLVKQGGGGFGSGGSGGTGGGGGGGGSGGPSKDDKEHNEKTLAALQAIKDELKALLAKSTPGGEGGDAAGDSAVAAKANIDTYNAINKVAGSTRIEIEQWGKLFTEGMGIEFTKNIGNINKSLFEFGQSITDISAGWRKAANEALSIMEMGQGGMIDVTSLLTDLGSSIISNRDALQESAKTVIEFRDQGQLLIGTLGNNLEEVSQALKRNREAVDDAFGDDFLGAIPFEQQNEILTNILDVQRRVGVTSDMNTILSSRNTRTQLEYLKEISFQTGQTVKEVMKLYKEEAKTFNQLEGLGLLQKGEGETTARQAQKLKGAGQGAMVDLLTDIIEAGGVTKWMGKDDSNAAFGAVPGNIEALNKALAGFKSGTNAGADAVMEAGREFSNLTTGSEQHAGGLLEAFPGLKAIAGIKLDAQGRSKASFDDVAEAKAAQDETFVKGNVGATIAKTYNDIKEFLANNFGAGGDLVLAVLANTAALILNTLAQSRNFMGPKMPGRMSKMMKGAKGMGGGLANMARTGVMGSATAVSGITTAGGMTAGAGALATTGAALTAAGAVGYAIGTGLEKTLQHFIPDQMAAAGDTVFGALDNALAFFGNDDAQERIRVQEKIDQMKLADKKARAESALVRKGRSPVKGVNPVTAGDTAAVAPSEVVSSSKVIAPEDNPVNKELMRQSGQFDIMINLLTQGNADRQQVKDTIGQGVMASAGKPSNPAYRRGAQKPADTFTKLLDPS